MAITSVTIRRARDTNRKARMVCTPCEMKNSRPIGPKKKLMLSTSLSGTLTPVVSRAHPKKQKLNTMNERYLILSATAPETIVAAVPANTNWKKNFTTSGTPDR